MVTLVRTVLGAEWAWCQLVGCAALEGRDEPTAVRAKVIAGGELGRRDLESCERCEHGWTLTGRAGGKEPIIDTAGRGYKGSRLRWKKRDRTGRAAEEHRECRTRCLLCWGRGSQLGWAQLLVWGRGGDLEPAAERNEGRGILTSDGGKGWSEWCFRSITPLPKRHIWEGHSV